MAVSLQRLAETGERQDDVSLGLWITAPNADQTALRAAQLADVVLIPCRAATFDLEAIQATLTLAELAKKPSFVVLNAIPPRSGIGREAAEGLTAQGARVAPTMLSQRAAFAHGVVDGRTAQEFEPTRFSGSIAAATPRYSPACRDTGPPSWGGLRVSGLE